jgi:hypothetical protein
MERERVHLITPHRANSLCSLRRNSPVLAWQRSLLFVRHGTEKGEMAFVIVGHGAGT